MKKQSSEVFVVSLEIYLLAPEELLYSVLELLSRKLVDHTVHRHCRSLLQKNILFHLLDVINSLLYQLFAASLTNREMHLCYCRSP